MRRSTILGAGLVAGMPLGVAVQQLEDGRLILTLSNPNISTFVVGFGGVLLGGIISFALARQSSIETLRRDTEARRAQEHSSALRALVTAMQLANRIFTTRNVIRKAIEEGGEDGPWAALRAISGLEAAGPRFLAEDFIPFINDKHADIVHRAMLLADRADALDAAFRAYSKERLEFQTFAEANTSFVNGQAITKFEGENARRADFRIKAMNALISQMSSFAEEYQQDAAALCTDMNSSFANYFGEAANFKLVMDAET